MEDEDEKCLVTHDASELTQLALMSFYFVSIEFCSHSKLFLSFPDAARSP